ncbi:hypothetical protein Nepgr_029107 [Nepenthes gracilis]|uniref:Uncharacterized protein n=1 Tax=Nepenthes gracilis TaxID=150966 RepID=A0AAD3TDH4_NEPGR|nr:hypothetical protein Nepgr_029107 [Nepenthes gracilis]
MLLAMPRESCERSGGRRRNYTSEPGGKREHPGGSLENSIHRVQKHRSRALGKVRCQARLSREGLPRTPSMVVAGTARGRLPSESLENGRRYSEEVKESRPASRATTRKEAHDNGGMVEPFSLAKKTSHKAWTTTVSIREPRRASGPSNSFPSAHQGRAKPESPHRLSDSIGKG